MVVHIKKKPENYVAIDGMRRRQEAALPTQSESSQEIDIEFRGVTMRFGEIVAVDDVSLTIERGGFFSFLGPSGCGKTTSLRLIAGFEQPSAGEVKIGGASVVGVPPYKRSVNMVFQHYSLFPHLTVADNVGYGLRQVKPRLAKSEIAKRIDETLELVRLVGFGRRRIWEMSGGQQQRVALARALINEPKVLLLDEPLAALDRKLRREMQIELQNLQRNVGITFILVTHDQEEALSMSDRICIMREGRVAQIGTPRELYDRPSSRYVADFVGKSNFFDGVVASTSGLAAEVGLDCGITIPAATTRDAKAFNTGNRVSVSVRPEQLVLARDEARLPADSAIRIEARVVNRIFLGEHTEYLLRNDRLGAFLALSPRQNELSERPFETGETVQVAWSKEAALMLRDN
jgi:spermidine/putrescine transport system ATP-binding protein